MVTHLNRRQVLGGCLAGSLVGWMGASGGVAEARSPVARSGTARFRPAIAAYTFRKYFSLFRGREQQPAGDGPPMTLKGFVDYCGRHGCDAELTAYFFPNDTDDESLRGLKAHAFLSGTAISGAAIGNDFTVERGELLEKQIVEAQGWIRRSAVLGAPHLRIFAGTAKQLGDSAEKMADVCEAVNRCAATAKEVGVFLGIENHGGISSDQLIEILGKVQSDWVGINLDTGNFISADPYEDIRRCAPFAVNVQLKPTIKTPDGRTADADWPRIAEILREAKYQGYVALEYEDELPYERVPGLVQKLRDAFTA